MIFSDQPSPAKASNQTENPLKGFAQAGNRIPLFGFMLYVLNAASTGTR